MSQRIDNQPAFVLHTRAYRDTSLLVDLFTASHGRVSAVARGVRRRHSEQRALLNPFCPLLVSWSGKSSLKTLTGAERGGRAHRLMGDRLYSGFYLNELLVRLLADGDAHPTLFSHYSQALDALAASEPALEPVLREFELGLLAELGYAVDLARQHDGRPLEPQAHYEYLSETGFRPVGQVSSAAGFSGADLLAMEGGDYSHESTRLAAKQLTRTLLAPLLGSRPLHSRALFRRRAPGSLSED